MQKCQDNYSATFSSYLTLLDYHEEQAKGSQWIRCKVNTLQIEPLGKTSPLTGNLAAFAPGTTQEAVDDTVENLGLAMRVDGNLYPMRMTAYHFQMVNAYVKFVLNERRFGPKTDADGQKKRETALASFERVVQDGKKRFTSFSAGTNEQYKKSISQYVNTILPVWMQYRNTYINL